MLSRISQSCAHTSAIILAVILILIASRTGGAVQAPPGSLNGTVKDPSGAVIVGAQVTIRNHATGEARSTATNNEGRFKFDNVALGTAGRGDADREFNDS